MGNEGSIEPIPYEVDLAWNKVDPKDGGGAPPSGREAHVAALIGRKVYIFGGGSGTTQHADLFSFDVDQSTWTEHQVEEGQISPPKSTGACASIVGNSFYVFGGLNMEQEWLDELYVFSTDTQQWKKPDVTGKGPSRRDKQSCCAVGHKIYFFGGFGPQEQPDEEEEAGSGEGAEEEEEEEAGGSGPCATFGWFNDLYVLDTESMTWQQLTTQGTPPTARAAAAMTSVGNKLYLFGGRDSTQRQNDLHVLDLDTLTWSLPRLSGARPIARSFHTLTAISNQYLALVGGLSSTNLLLNDVHVLDIGASAWLQPRVNETGQLSPRRFHSATLVDKTLFVFGGSSEFDSTTNECTKFHNDIHVLPLGPILEFGHVKMPEAASGGTTLTSSGLINLTAPFQPPGETPGLFSFEDKGMKRKRDDNDDAGREKEEEDDTGKEKEKNS